MNYILHGSVWSCHTLTTLWFHTSKTFRGLDCDPNKGLAIPTWCLALCFLCLFKHQFAWPQEVLWRSGSRLHASFRLSKAYHRFLADWLKCKTSQNCSIAEDDVVRQAIIPLSTAYQSDALTPHPWSHWLAVVWLLPAILEKSDRFGFWNWRCFYTAIPPCYLTISNRWSPRLFVTGHMQKGYVMWGKKGRPTSVRKWGLLWWFLLQATSHMAFGV